jgi:hypothetical protein
MVRLECIPKEDKYEHKIWMCSVDGSPRFEATIRIVAKTEHIIIPDKGDVFIADVDMVTVNREKGYIRIWAIR